MKPYLFICLLSALPLIAEEVSTPQPTTQATDWTFKVGLNFRSFGDLSIQPMTLNSGGFLNGSVTDFGGGQFLYTVEAPLAQISGVNLDLVTFSTADQMSGSDDIDSGTGFAINGLKIVETKDNFSWGYSVSFTTAFSDTSSRFNGALSDTQYNLGANWNTLPDSNGDVPILPPPGAPVDGKTEAVSGNNTPITTGGSDSTLKVHYDLDLSLYTLGTGLTAHWQNEKLAIFAAAGPTLSIVDFDIENSVTAQFADGSNFFNQSESDDGTKLRLGTYFELGLELEINETWGAGFSTRYDWVPVEVNSDLAEMELSGLSAQIFVAYQF